MSEQFAQVVPRLVAYLGIFTLVGATGLAARLSADLGAASERMRGRALGLATTAAAVLVVAALVTLYSQTDAFFGSDEGVTVDTLRIIAMETGWGAGWRVQFGAATFALIGVMLVRRGVTYGWPVLGVGAIAAAAAQSFTGHAFEGSWLATTIVAQAIHVVAGSLWIGSLLVIASIVLRHESDDAVVATVVERFSPLAVASVGALALSGALSTYFYLAGPADLINTTYGRVLLAKTTGFAIVAALGFHNWQTVRPQLGSAVGTARLRRAVTAEVAVALVVLVLTAFLVGLPLPAWGM